MTIQLTDPSELSDVTILGLIKKKLGPETFLPVDIRPNGRPLYELRILRDLLLLGDPLNSNRDFSTVVEDTKLATHSMPWPEFTNHRVRGGINGKDPKHVSTNALSNCGRETRRSRGEASYHNFLSSSRSRQKP